MAKLPDPFLKRDLLRLLVVACVLLGLLGFLAITPAISAPFMIAVVVTMLLSPIVTFLERRGMSKSLAISTLFVFIGAVLSFFGIWAVGKITSDWDSFSQEFPKYVAQAMERIGQYQEQLRSRSPLLADVRLTQTATQWLEDTRVWVVTNGTAVMGQALTWALLVPFFAFVFLKDGPALRKQFFALVPNRYFESSFMMTVRISRSLSDYVRAKLVEATLVGLMCGIGLAVVGAPYAGVLGVIAGVTNIVPYVGPILGAIAALLIPLFDPAYAQLLWPVVIVYTVANVIDNVLIFPLLVASLVNLHPVILIAVVIVGQQYYGLVGMLISIPLAAVIKVILQEILAAIYRRVRIRHVA